MRPMRFHRLSSATLALILAGLNLAACQGTSPSTSPAPLDASGLSNGEILYGYRCKGCHEPATPGAPNRKELAGLDRREIVKALRSGRMKPLATGLTRDEMN